MSFTPPITPVFLNLRDIIRVFIRDGVRTIPGKTGIARNRISLNDSLKSSRRCVRSRPAARAEQQRMQQGEFRIDLRNIERRISSVRFELGDGDQVKEN